MYAQYVKNTTQPLNITDVTKDQRFPWTVRLLFLTPLFSVLLCSVYCIVYFLFLSYPVLVHLIEDGRSDFFSFNGK